MQQGRAAGGTRPTEEDRYWPRVYAVILLISVVVMLGLFAFTQYFSA